MHAGILWWQRQRPQDREEHKTSSHKSNTITKTQKLSQVCLEARHCLETGSPSLVVWSSRQQLAVTSLGEPECDSAVTQWQQQQQQRQLSSSVTKNTVKWPKDWICTAARERADVKLISNRFERSSHSGAIPRVEVEHKVRATRTLSIYSAWMDRTSRRLATYGNVYTTEAEQYARSTDRFNILAAGYYPQQRPGLCDPYFIFAYKITPKVMDRVGSNFVDRSTDYGSGTNRLTVSTPYKDGHHGSSNHWAKCTPEFCPP